MIIFLTFLYSFRSYTVLFLLVLLFTFKIPPFLSSSPYLFSLPFKRLSSSPFLPSSFCSYPHLYLPLTSLPSSLYLPTCSLSPFQVSFLFAIQSKAIGFLNSIEPNPLKLDRILLTLLCLIPLFPGIDNNTFTPRNRLNNLPSTVLVSKKLLKKNERENRRSRSRNCPKCQSRDRSAEASDTEVRSGHGFL